MASSRSSMTLSVSEHEKAQLEQLALDFDQRWGEKPNVSKLIKAIAQKKLSLAINHNWSRDRIDTLNKALNLLKDAGEYGEAKELAHVLLERSELNSPLRKEIETWMSSPGSEWRSQLDDCCRLKRPFRLIYQDAAGLVWNFTVRHAEINRHEDRYYLDCWCDETKGNKDIEALKHNRCLRLDRIPEEALIVQVPGTWKPNLAFVDVEFHLSGRLATAYRSKTGKDKADEWLEGATVRKVVRRVRNTFWFFRQARKYGSGFTLIGPADVRDRFIAELKQSLNNYT